MTDPNAPTKSTKTTVAGIMILISSILACVGFLIDGNPATNPDWSWLHEVLSLVGLGGTGIGGSILGVAAKDNNPTPPSS